VRSPASGASIQREGSAVLASLSTSQLLTFSTSSLVPFQRFNASLARRRSPQRPKEATVRVTEG
jgi:hypothetical protein